MFVCVCNGVTDSDIRDAIEDGVTCVRDLHQSMGVGDCCGKCTRIARQVIKAHLQSVEVESLAYEAV